MAALLQGNSSALLQCSRFIRGDDCRLLWFSHVLFVQQTCRCQIRRHVCLWTTRQWMLFDDIPPLFQPLLNSKFYFIDFNSWKVLSLPFIQLNPPSTCFISPSLLFFCLSACLLTRRHSNTFGNGWPIRRGTSSSRESTFILTRSSHRCNNLSSEMMHTP